jgi:23S rRNA pseudouridine955/2504/2580 synthase
MFLHAFTAEVTHPVTGKKLRIEAPLAEDLRRFLLELDAAGVPLRS